MAKATANNELGIAAKVLPRQEDEDPRKDRLICVYTADFMDKTDVGRVLQRLRELRLVEARSKRIYYKPGLMHPPYNNTTWLTSYTQMPSHTWALRVEIRGV